MSCSEGSDDWRNYDFKLMTFANTELPASVRKALMDLAQIRGLHFTGIDLIHSESGDYYFLEMNRPGAWGFIESLSDLRIGETIAEFLSR